ncbi:uncharacterized protein K452DRAFT_309060 [Aplosporella prunicola CBS 121167]|uniref:Piwi domain-containing protein n=1 Tax=Aplosporella prunicola CBS 121167 TaxID=1176127 RepID=A0A6A6BCF3_9PEZI|nr:uncharacterized protein K452DRAFT_309060 [Aplosporella prunicola CBS 121167]KAF2141278.1 hypothetical protein K452DRAFT_309060 [Aplosporella prunicola CBS 121167]
MDDDRCGRCGARHPTDKCTAKTILLKKFWPAAKIEEKREKENEWHDKDKSRPWINIEADKCKDDKTGKPILNTQLRAQPRSGSTPAQAGNAAVQPAPPPPAQEQPTDETPQPEDQQKVPPPATPDAVSEKSPWGNPMKPASSPQAKISTDADRDVPAKSISQSNTAQVAMSDTMQTKPVNKPQRMTFPPPKFEMPKAVFANAENKSIHRNQTHSMKELDAKVNYEKNAPEADIESKSRRKEFGFQNETEVTTNYVWVRSVPPQLHEYKIEIGLVKIKTQGEDAPKTKEIKRRSELRQVFEGLRESYPLSGKDDWATDFSYVWSVSELFKGTELTLRDFEYRKQSGKRAVISDVIFKLQQIHSFADGVRGLIHRPDNTNNTANQTNSTGVAQKLRALNAIVSRYMSLSTDSTTQVGANRFFLNHGYTNLGSSPLLAVRGYFSSLRPGMSKMLININTSTSVFFKPILVSEFLERAKRDCNLTRDVAKRILKGVTVRITYNRPWTGDGDDPGDDPNAEVNRRRVIAGFGDLPENQTFKKDGKITNVFDYFREQGAPLRRGDSQCVNVGVAKPGCECWIPAQLLEIVYPQPFTSVLPSMLTRDMLRAALRRPAENAYLILSEGLVHLGIVDDPTKVQRKLSAKNKPFNLKEDISFDVDDKLINVPAHFLPQPKLNYGRNQSLNIRSASWNLVQGRGNEVAHQFVQSSHLPGIFILDLCYPHWRFEDIKTLASNLVDTLKAHGITVGAGRASKPGTVSINRGGSFNESAVALVKRFETYMKQAAVTLVLLPKGDDNDIYAAVKKACDAKGLLTICTKGTPSQLTNGQRLSNLALKYSLKTGGRPHDVDRKSSGSFPSEDTMVLGADVTHPARGAVQGCPSVAAVVGSFDKHFINYAGSMRLQRSKSEIIAGMHAMVTELLQIYKGKNSNRLPRNIIFYRDGVSEVQYQDVRKNEIKAIRDAWEDIHREDTAKRGTVKKDNTEETVKITCLVVGKRHHTRFYPKNERDKDRTNNTRPGLVVDSVITHPYCYDFFLQAHAALQGTARPAHYFLLRNDMELKEKQLVEVTHNLCYVYGIATKGISYCAPAYLADKLCERGRAYIRDWLLYRSYTIPPSTAHETIEHWHTRIANELMSHTDYNDQSGSRKNPWHPSLDDKMFWV